MSNYPSIKYFIHDGSAKPEPSGENAAGLAAIFAGDSRTDPCYASADELAAVIVRAREDAVKRMADGGAKHAVYAVKHYDTENSDAVTADIYTPAVLLDEAEFVKNTNTLVQEDPGCYILAIHAVR